MDVEETGCVATELPRSYHPELPAGAGAVSSYPEADKTPTPSSLRRERIGARQDWGSSGDQSPSQYTEESTRVN
ncbi:unnamed protein product [Arctogadus glacialis]